MNRFKYLSVILVLLTMAINSRAQLDLPQASPKATVAQTFGITEVKIEYSSPGVKERTIWGGLVPYNEIWRTGANQATRISFSTDVMVEGNSLPKGQYAIFTIPTESSWTIIFSKQTDLWGAMGYEQEQDALRIQVKPRPAEFRERMTFYFNDATDNSVKAVLHWEKLMVSFTIQAATQELVMKQAEQEISWRTPYQAANYALTNNLDMTKMENWLNLSLSIEKNYWNTALKARFLEKQGKRKEAIKSMQEAITMGKAMERPPFNIAEMEALLAEWQKK